MNGKGVQKDIAYYLLKKYMTQDVVKKYRKTDSLYSKLDVGGFIGQMNLIVKVYNKFLFEQDFLTPQQMADLVTGFKSKLGQFIT